ncbi:type II secretion system protein GspM [Aureimonas sp. AU4]|uniref:type II secretion system protein GspM n=1 Tax=Aureimonas sp. AU4 TaxID=1638163 RepID=UPI000706799D|nr:type II secretion system protein GspM [Aureimonas sp. AU4]BAT30582.1 hypothetical protein [Aureimonas sp. AU4]
MNRAAPTPLRRWTALTLLVIVPPVLVLLALGNAASTADIRSQTELADAQLERFRQRLAGETRTTPPQSGAGLVIEGSSRSLAEAELQRRLVALGEASSFRIVESASSALTAETAAAFLEARATLDGDNGGLLKLLHAIETGLPLMTLARLDVRRLDGENEEAGADPRLRIELVVRAPWKATVS